MYSELFLKVGFMDIQSWFSSQGSYADGVMLYSKLPTCNGNILRGFARENTANFLKLKYELKKASLSLTDTNVAQLVKVAPEKIASIPRNDKSKESEPLLQEIIKQSAAVSFEKETMAMYPMELHATYRQRVSDFYLACELKFQLNSIADDDENDALKIIVQLDDLWTKIDRAWMILGHWKDHNRIMPTESHEDFSQVSGNKLVMLRDNLQSSISKREKTIESMQERVKASPEDRTILNLLNRKLEQLEQKKIDLETIRKKLKDE
jgi:hypothetical protein